MSKTIPVYDAHYTLRSSHATRAEAMDEARRLAGGASAEYRIFRDGGGVVAVYDGPGGRFAAADGMQVVWS